MLKVLGSWQGHGTVPFRWTTWGDSLTSSGEILVAAEGRDPLGVLLEVAGNRLEAMVVMVEGWLKIRDLVVNYYSDSWVGWFTILIVEHSWVIYYSDLCLQKFALAWLWLENMIRAKGLQQDGQHIDTIKSVHLRICTDGSDCLWFHLMDRMDPKCHPNFQSNPGTCWHMLAHAATFRAMARWGMDPPTEKARESTCSAGNPWEPWDDLRCRPVVKLYSESLPHDLV